VSRLPLVLLLLLLTGCSEPPQKEIDEAQSAIDAARAAGADKYLPDEFSAAAATLQKSHAAVDQRDYRQALSYAIDARQRAINASKAVIDARARAKQDAEALLREATTRADRLEALIKAAGEAHVSPRDLHPVRLALADARNVLQEARSSLDARQFLEASASVKAVREKLDAATKELTSIPSPAKTGKEKTGKKK